MLRISSFISRRKFNHLCLATVSLGLAIAINSCGTSQSGAGQYEATAKATYTWRVRYTNAPTDDKRGHYEEFESTSLTTVNGQKPEGAVMKENEKDVWWPKLPPKPSVDEIESGKKNSAEKIGKLELGQNIEYRVKFDKDGEKLNLPTNYNVYRQVSKSYPDIPLDFTMGINNGSVTKATPVTN
ncbi:MAG: hypothetical protein HC775_16250 [Hyellaceae cyanobacterium CSU_1_1]|nr:hypothetical protein [Hyellaceae cyanobacterium CSU_1_1]